ncbi:MAG: hypothetical protein J0I12_14520 [Candidatus Eremiobacteraeota bacterium]|nr:hypothetical protein [Candidatus Eremiobacteraeota bacterium]
MRKRTEMGEMDAVRRIPTVKGKDYNPRQNAYRLAVEQDDWAGARPARLEAQRKRAPANPANRKPLNVQLFVTRYRSSVRQWAQIEGLLERLNELFAAPQIVFQMIEPAECNRSVSYAQRCPFGADLDHEYEFLHMGVVPRLPEEMPVLTSCGRCFLISDRSSDENIARALAQLLGLEPGAELDFTETQIQWLRWQAFLLQGQPVPLPLVGVPVWAYPVVTPDDFHSQRGLEQIRQFLEKVNLIWLQAGVCLELAGCCPLHRDDLDSAGWEQAVTPEVEPLLPLLQFGPQALHLPMIRGVPVPWSCFAFPSQRVAIVRDGITPLSAAQAVGRLLGLSEVAGVDQLMSGGAEGNRLSVDESRRARQRALELTGLAEDAPLREVTRQARRQWLAPARPLERTIEFQLILLRGPDSASRQTLEDARNWVGEAAAIWAQAGIELRANLSEAEVAQAAVEAAYPNPGGARKPSCSGLTRLPAYRAGSYNLCVLQHLPVVNKPEQFQAYLNWPGPRLTLLAEDFPAHGRAKQLALALAVAWGVKAGSGSFERLLTRSSQGLRVDETDLSAVFGALAGPSFQPVAQPAVRSAGQLLTLPVKLRRVKNAVYGSQAIQEDLTAGILSEPFWEQANIRLQFLECDEVEVSDAALQESFPSQPGSGAPRLPFNFGLLRLSGHHPLALNLLLVESVPGGLFSSFPLSKMVLAEARSASAGMAQLLGVNLGQPVTAQSLEAARASLIRLFPTPVA